MVIFDPLILFLFIGLKKLISIGRSLIRQVAFPKATQKYEIQRKKGIDGSLVCYGFSINCISEQDN